MYDAISTLAEIAVAHEAELVLVDHYPNPGPLKMLCERLQVAAGRAPRPLVRIYADRKKLRECSGLRTVAERLVEDGARIRQYDLNAACMHDRFVAVRTRGTKGDVGAVLLTAMLLGNGIDMFEGWCAAATCARVHGHTLEALERLLAVSERGLGLNLTDALR